MTSWAEGQGPAPAPWRVGAQARLWVAQLAVAAVVVTAGGIAAGRDSTADQIPWLNLAVVVAVVSALANGLWIVGARKRFAARRRAVLNALDARSQEPDTGAAADLAAVSGDEPLVAVAGLTRYHRPGCPLIAGRALLDASRAGHEQAQRSPCGWCSP